MPRKPKAKLYLRFRTPDGKQSPYCPALFDHKARIRPFWCLVKGVQELHRDGTYYRRVKRNAKWQWESLGNDANAAYAKLNVPRLLLVMPTAKNEAAAPTVKDGFRLDDEVAVYLSNVSKLSPKTFKAYGRSLELFRQSCKKIYVHQITKQDLQAFDTALLERGDEDRTRLTLRRVSPFSAASNFLPSSAVSQFPTRTPSRRTPFTRRMPAARSGLRSPQSDAS